MTPDDITRLADEVSALDIIPNMSAFATRDILQQCAGIAAELRTLAQQQGKAGGVTLDYVPGLLDQTCPPKIWLQIDTDGDNDDRSEAFPESAWGDLTWCYESIGGQEVVYIRADLVPPTHSHDAKVTDEMVECGYVIQDGSVVWLTEGPFSQYSLKPNPGAKVYTLAPQPKDAT